MGSLEARGRVLLKLNVPKDRLDARGRVLLKLNVPKDRLDAVIAEMPAAKSPTVNELYGDSGYAVESVVPKAGINTLIPRLLELGASDILEMPILKIIP